MHRLKGENAHFAKLFDSYHDVNKQIHRIETDIEPASDEHSETLRKQRMVLKDEIFGMIAGARVS